MNDCDKCKPCKPRKDTSCGQQLLALNMTCAPPGCFDKCCESSGVEGSGGTDYIRKSTEVVAAQMGWMSKNKGKVLGVLVLLAILALALFLTMKK